MRDRTREPLVRVAVAENELTAEEIRADLAAAGIRCMVKNRDATSVAWGGSVAASFSLEVFVLQGDAERATALLGGQPAPEPLPPPALSGERKKRRRWWGA